MVGRASWQEGLAERMNGRKPHLHPGRKCVFSSVSECTSEELGCVMFKALLASVWMKLQHQNCTILWEDVLTGLCLRSTQEPHWNHLEWLNFQIAIYHSMSSGIVSKEKRLSLLSVPNWAAWFCKEDNWCQLFIKQPISQSMMDTRLLLRNSICYWRCEEVHTYFIALGAFSVYLWLQDL